MLKKQSMQTKQIPQQTIEADHTPALTFDGDNIVDDAVAQARARGLTVNCRVSASKELRGFRKGATGILKRMEKDIHVLWDMGSRVDGSDKSVSSCELAPMTLSLFSGQPHLERKRQWRKLLLHWLLQ